MFSKSSIVVVLAALLCQQTVSAQVTFLDITSLTPGPQGVGGFTGTLGSVGVTGSLTALGGPNAFFINPATAGLTGGIGDSTVDNLSPQYSYPTIYSHTLPGVDRIGWTSLPIKTEQMVITFTSPVSNPIFHVANIDWAQFTFVGTPGLISVTYLNSNTGAGDGLDTSPAAAALFRVQDAGPPTSDATIPGLTPPSAGPRSGYGSIQLDGTFTTILIGFGTAGGGTDTGSFTISVPEPGSILLIGSALVVTGGVYWNKRRRQGRGRLAS